MRIDARTRSRPRTHIHIYMLQSIYSPWLMRSYVCVQRYASQPWNCTVELHCGSCFFFSTCLNAMDVGRRRCVDAPAVDFELDPVSLRPRSIHPSSSTPRHEEEAEQLQSKVRHRADDTRTWESMQMRMVAQRRHAHASRRVEARARAEEIEQLQYKVVILGAGAVGKTSLRVSIAECMRSHRVATCGLSRGAARRRACRPADLGYPTIGTPTIGANCIERHHRHARGATRGRHHELRR
jgi:hypothetical protein